jgi:RNA polymerase sigma-70 factor (ECF subfamily)
VPAKPAPSWQRRKFGDLTNLLPEGVAMTSDLSFVDLMTRLRSGNNEAASKIFHHFASQLIVLARERLDKQTLQKVDAEDIIQSVFRSFFGHQAAGELVDLTSWDSVWGMLVVMTLGKCRRQRRHFHADRRDVRREVSFTPLPGESGAGWQPYDREPTPAEAAVLTETVLELLKEFEGRPGQILTLFLQGCNPLEISSQIGCTERAVYRTYERVKVWLQRRASE